VLIIPFSWGSQLGGHLHAIRVVGGLWVKVVEVAGAIAANDLGLGAKVLDRETKRVKFNGRGVISGKTTNRNKIFHKVRNNKNIVE
jgi:hypothetical protein